MTAELTPDKLDQIERDAHEALDAYDYVGVDLHDALALVAWARELEAQVKRVLVVHEREDIAAHPGYGMESRCMECNQHWPCNTIKALGGDA